MEGTGSVRESECFVQRVFLLSLPPSFFFFNTQKANMSNFKFQLGFNACNCVKKILKLSDNMYSNKLSSVF